MSCPVGLLFGWLTAFSHEDTAFQQLSKRVHHTLAQQGHGDEAGASGVRMQVLTMGAVEEQLQARYADTALSKAARGYCTSLALHSKPSGCVPFSRHRAGHGDRPQAAHLVAVVTVGAVLQQAGLGVGLAVVAQPWVGRAPVVAEICASLDTANKRQRSRQVIL